MTMAESSRLTNHFLIAMPSLADPNFFHTVTYICDHNEQGAMGLVINRPLGIDLGELLPHLQIESDNPMLTAVPIYQGGPVQSDRGFVLHQPLGEWQASLEITDDIALTMSQDIIETIAQGEGPARYLIALGYAGWGAGQLEQEIVENAWLSGPADVDILFDKDAGDRWSASAALLGVELSLLSTDVGHA